MVSAIRNNPVDSADGALDFFHGNLEVTRWCDTERGSGSCVQSGLTPQKT